MVIEVKEMEYNKIIQGDCLDVMKQLLDKSIDLIVTSLIARTY